MANTYSQVFIQTVFAPKNRQALIQNEWREELYKYISGIVANQGHKLIIINGTSNHVHAFIGMKPMQSLSGLMQDIKGDSSKWINKNQFVKGKFEWQLGYGAFSYSIKDIDRVYRYIDNQELHHRKKTFIEEYTDLLEEFNIQFDKRFLFANLE
jgi:REP element-mobilizing transposase RayT